jgi:hypothetical protein
MSGRTVLRITHVCASVGVLGADLTLLLLGAAGLHGADARTIYPAAHLIGLWAAIPLAVASLATGALLVAITDWKPWRHRWLAVKAAITVTLTGLLIGVLVPGLGRAAAGSPPHTGQVLDTIAPAVGAGLLIVNVILGMTKPRLGATHRQ